MLFDTLLRMWGKSTKMQQQTEVDERPLSEKDVGWSDVSAIYTSSDFEKYNPDGLIGVKGHSIYQRMMNDEQVKAVTRFKRDAITSREHFFELDGDKYGLSEKEVDARIELSEFIIENIKGSWIDAKNGIMTATYNGFSMTEIIPATIELNSLTWWGIHKLKLKPFDTFIFYVDEYGNIERTVQKLGGKEQDIDLDKFVYYVVNPDVDEHYGGSELRAAYRAWFSKDMAIKFRNIWLERHAGGFHVIQAKDGHTITPGTAEYASLANILSNINVSTGALLPSTVVMESKYPSNKADYNSAVNENDTAIARALLVPNLMGISPQGDTGSFAQSQTQLETFFWTLEASSVGLDDALNEQLFRKLGRLNYGDDSWPRYKSKPISDSKKVEVVKMWQDLVSAGAVTATDTDEAFIRELLGFPDPGEEINKSEQIIPTLPANNDEESSGNTDDNESPNSNEKEGKENDEDLAAKDSTIIGKGSVSIESFSRAFRRVDFAVIAKSSDGIVDEYSQKTAESMDIIIADLISKAKSGGALDEDVRNNIRALKVDKKLRQNLNRLQTAMLREGVKMGAQHASLEIDKAKKDSFSRQVDTERLDMIAEDFFQTTAFKITGNLTDDAVNTIETEILNGARYGKSWKEVESSIYSRFATKGMITTEQAKEALGEALGVSNPDARLRTIARTSTFDAINNARYAYFTDPQLGDFVQAFEYSAILDGRTTTICRHLDEEDRGNHSKEWYANNAIYRPPNHFNCRSILVPVTKLDVDTFTEGEEPTIQPQEGFK